MQIKKIYGIKNINNQALRRRLIKSATIFGRLNSVSEVAVVHNPSYIYPAYEFYPLADRIIRPLSKISGIVTDMDGTTTTTEELCLHSLEYMVRLITNRMAVMEWSGLDHSIDYPHIIGNSTTKHVEYLITRYKKSIHLQSLCSTYLRAAIWTLARGRDQNRRQEVMNSLDIIAKGDILKEMILTKLSHGSINDKQLDVLINQMVRKHSSKLLLHTKDEMVRAGIDIYYQRYHYLLAEIDSGRDSFIKKTLFEGRQPIGPMPAVGIYLALVKGWLGHELDKLYPILESYLLSHSHINYSAPELRRKRPKLAQLGQYFKNHPVPVAIVTSSIEYEAQIVLRKVFSVIKEQVADWPVSSQLKRHLLSQFASYNNVYNALITASDSSEMRLKPHRDLFSLALYRLGLKPSEFDSVIGFEDSESGLLAIRSAGIGKSVAVPFSATKGHDLSSASTYLYGGLPEAILFYNNFLKLR